MTGKLTYQELLNQNKSLREELLRCKHVAQLMLQESESRLNIILESVDDHMSMVDRNLNIIWVNETARRQFGDNLVGTKCYESYCGRSEPCNYSSCIAIQTFMDGKTHNHQSKVELKNGKTIYLRGTSNVVSRDKNGFPDAVIKISKDVTNKIEAGEELQKTMAKLRQNLAGTIQAMSLIIETRDLYTAGHQRRATDLARAIAQEMGLSEDQVDGIRMAGVIHDLGKICIPSEILSKPGEITDVEYNLIKSHPRAGYEILKEIDFQWPIAEIVLQHHERLDGSGYPYGLSGKDILLEARVIAVADVVEAMSSHRPYRAALGIEQAFEEITRNRGSLYDPEVVDASLNLFTNKGFQFNC